MLERKAKGWLFLTGMRSVSNAIEFASKLIAPRQERTSRIGLLQLPTSAQKWNKRRNLKGARAIDEG